MKKERQSMSEGSLQEIYDLFFKPLMYYKPDDMPLTDWLAELFHTDHRTLKQYQANKDFKLPGLFYEAPSLKIQGLGYRSVTAGTVVMVRQDSRETTYDIEFFGGVGEGTQVFSLSETEWNSIAANLVEVKGHIKRKLRKRERNEC